MQTAKKVAAPDAGENRNRDSNFENRLKNVQEMSQNVVDEQIYGNDVGVHNDGRRCRKKSSEIVDYDAVPSSLDSLLFLAHHLPSFQCHSVHHNFTRTATVT